MIFPRFNLRLKPLFTMMLVFSVLVLPGCFFDDDDEPRSSAPSFTSGTAISVGDGSTATGYTATATDADGDTVTFSLSGGTDQSAFTIDSDSGELSFNTAPVFDNPGDSDGDNVYVVDITATDGKTSVMQTVTVTYVADHAGYYSNAGTASVDNGMGGTLGINDLQAMVTGTRMIMLSAANELLYDGTITDITGDNFTADFTIYTAGENPVTATASGTITAGSSITGTLTGTGVGNGQFSLLYANTNDQAATITSAWLGSGGGFEQFGFIINSVGSLAHDRSTSSLLFDACDMNGTVTPVSGTRLYSVDVELTGCFVSGFNGGPNVNGTYTGLTTTRDGNMGDLLVFSVANGTYTLSGELNID